MARGKESAQIEKLRAELARRVPLVKKVEKLRAQLAEEVDVDWCPAIENTVSIDETIGALLALLENVPMRDKS